MVQPNASINALPATRNAEKLLKFLTKLIRRDLALPALGVVGGVSDADRSKGSSLSCVARQNRGQNPLPQCLLHKPRCIQEPITRPGQK